MAARLATLPQTGGWEVPAGTTDREGTARRGVPAFTVREDGGRRIRQMTGVDDGAGQSCGSRREGACRGTAPERIPTQGRSRYARVPVVRCDAVPARRPARPRASGDDALVLSGQARPCPDSVRPESAGWPFEAAGVRLFPGERSRRRGTAKQARGQLVEVLEAMNRAPPRAERAAVALRAGGHPPHAGHCAAGWGLTDGSGTADGRTCGRAGSRPRRGRPPHGAGFNRGSAPNAPAVAARLRHPASPGIESAAGAPLDSGTHASKTILVSAHNFLERSVGGGGCQLREARYLSHRWTTIARESGIVKRVRRAVGGGAARGSAPARAPTVRPRAPEPPPPKHPMDP